MKLEDRFANYVRQNRPWVYNYQKVYCMGDLEYPFGISMKEMLDMTANRLNALKMDPKVNPVDQIFSNVTFDVIMTAWGMLFNKIETNLDRYTNFEDCEREYNEFLRELNVWVTKNSNSLIA